MHSPEFVPTGCAILMMVLAFAFVSYRKLGQKPKGAAKEPSEGIFLPPDEFCRKVLAEKPARMVILHVGDACATPGKGRRYEFRTAEPKSGKSFRTYFDDATNGSGKPAKRPTSQKMQVAVGHIQAMMQFTNWQSDKRKGTLANPARYLAL